MDPDIPYLLLTPGPLTTSRTVRAAMQQDFCTWDSDYNEIVSEIRQKLVELASPDESDYTSVLMQGSGTFSVEAAIGSLIPPDGKLLVISNGAYGKRIAQIAERLRIALDQLVYREDQPPQVEQVAERLRDDPSITHVAMVHCETTTGMLNPVAEVGHVVQQAERTFLVDAMSSFGGIPMTMESIGADVLVSSANKCIQGTPGFGFVIGRRDLLKRSQGWARSLSLDLYDQWREMEQNHGKWRYTSPTHVVRAFRQALDELDAEGGVAARHQRYCVNQQNLVEGMQRLGFRTLLPRDLQSPIITSFVYPDEVAFEFQPFYEALKRRRFVIYPGKITGADTFRIGSIGHVFPEDVDQLIDAVDASLNELGWRLSRV